MRRLFLLLAVLFVVPLFGSDSPKEYDDRTEVAGIEGTWRPIEDESDGKKEKVESYWVATYRNGTYSTNWNNDGDAVLGNYRIDTSHKPPYLDVTPTSGVSKGTTFKYIYQIDGDTLRIAYIEELRETPPQGFNDKGIKVDTYKRVK